MKKKISLPIAITAVLLAAAIAFTVAYFTATASINQKMPEYSEWQSKASEWQSKFGELSKVDAWVRENYEGKIDEDKLSEELCKAYSDAIGEDVLYVDKEDFDTEKYVQGENCETHPLPNGDVMVILK